MNKLNSLQSTCTDDSMLSDFLARIEETDFKIGKPSSTVFSDLEEILSKLDMRAHTGNHVRQSQRHDTSGTIRNRSNLDSKKTNSITHQTPFYMLAHIQ